MTNDFSSPKSHPTKLYMPSSTQQTAATWPPCHCSLPSIQ